MMLEFEIMCRFGFELKLEGKSLGSLGCWLVVMHAGGRWLLAGGRTLD